MSSIAWEDLRILKEVADAGSFRRAASSLGLDQATISRRVRQIEDGLGVPLFLKGADGVMPSGAGGLLLDAARPMAEAAESLDRLLARRRPGTAPEVVVASPAGLAAMVIGPALYGRLPDRHPLYAAAKAVRRGGAMPPVRFAPRGSPDVDIRILPGPEGQGPFEHYDPSWDLRPLANFVPGLAASRRYLDAHGAPQTFEDLAHHRMVLEDMLMQQHYPNFAPVREMVASEARHPVHRCDSAVSVIRGVGVGLGVGLVPVHSMHANPWMVSLSVGMPKLGIDLWIAADRLKLRMAAIRTLHQAIIDLFAALPGFNSVPSLMRVAGGSAGP